MSTLRSKTAFLTRIALASVAVYSVLPSKVAQLLVEDSVSAEIARSRSSTTFVLDGKGWTEFSIPPEQVLLKVVSNGNIPEALYGIQDLQCEYSVRLEVLDSRGTKIKSLDSVLRSGPLNYRDEETGAILPAQTFLATPLLPLSSRTTIINIEDLDGTARRLRLSLAQADPRVRDVSVRVYTNQKPAAYKLRYMWQRMPIEKRERLARGNVHGLEFLTDKEKENLLENRWVAIAPSGIDGSDFFERKIYTLKERYNAVLSGSILPRGILLGPGTLGTLPIPEDGGCVRLEIQRLPGSSPTPEVRAFWYRRGAVAPVETLLELRDHAMSWSEELDGGLLELESPDEVVVRAYLDSVANGIEITPETKCAQGYRIRKGAPVELSIVSSGEVQSAFRLDVRRIALAEGMDVPREIPLVYELLDDKRNMLGTGRLAHDERDSLYDRVTGTGKAIPVSDSSRHYFCLPPRCAIFRVSSDVEGACVTAYTRPFDLARRLTIPDDYQAFERAQDDARTWFPLRPAGYVECVASECEVFVKTQQRPPGPSDEIVASGWHAEACEPEGTARSLKLLTRVDLEQGAPREIAPAYFVKLDPGRDVDLYVGDATGLPAVAPRFICLKEDDSLANVSLDVDRRLHFQADYASRSSEDVLPPIAEGWHSMRVNAPPGAEAYVNSFLAPPESIFLERAVHAIGREGLRYRITKETTGRETIAFRLYLPRVARRDTTVTVSVRGAPKLEGIPSETWTYPETIYQIRPPEDEVVRALGSDEGPFSGGELFLLVLGSDMPQGACDVTVRLDEGLPSYLSVLHIVPGGKEERLLSSELNFIGGEVEQ